MSLFFWGVGGGGGGVGGWGWGGGGGGWGGGGVGGWGGGGGGGVWWLFQGIQFAISLSLSFVWISTFVMTGHPGLGWATQPPALGGPYGDQGFWFFKSTVTEWPQWHLTGRLCHFDLLYKLYQRCNWVHVMFTLQIHVQCAYESESVSIHLSAGWLTAARIHFSQEYLNPSLHWQTNQHLTPCKCQVNCHRRVVAS